MLGGLRARPNEIKARSSRPTWKNCSLWLCNVHCWNATQYYSTETVLLIFPFLQDQHHCSDEAKWRLGGRPRFNLWFRWIISTGTCAFFAINLLDRKEGLMIFLNLLLPVEFKMVVLKCHQCCRTVRDPVLARWLHTLGWDGWSGRLENWPGLSRHLLELTWLAGQSVSVPAQPGWVLDESRWWRLRTKRGSSKRGHCPHMGILRKLSELHSNAMHSHTTSTH